MSYGRFLRLESDFQRLQGEDMLWEWRKRSALFVDYENVAGVFSPAHIENLKQWFEDGGFDAGRKRKLLTKRIYCNPEALRHEETFRNHGFDLVLCENVVRLKNAADIRMSIDIVRFTMRRWWLREVILLTRDSDLLPLIDYLARKRKATVVLVDEDNERMREIFSSRASITIPVRNLREAADYERRVRLRELREAVNRFKTYLPKMRAKRPAQPPVPESVMQAAIELALQATSRKPNQDTARTDIEKALKTIPGFTTYGSGAYLGFGSYRALMLEIARRTDRIKVGDARGVNVRYVRSDREDGCGGA
jgi:hypothetical protein